MARPTFDEAAQLPDSVLLAQLVSQQDVDGGDFGSAFTLEGSVALDAGEAVIGVVGGVIANPTSVLTRPADTTPYAANDNVASSATAGSIVVPSITVARVTAGSGLIRRGRLVSNKTSGVDAISFRVGLWAAAPTFGGGDNAAPAIATGAASFLGYMTGVLSQFGDGSVGHIAPDIGSEIAFKLAAGTAIFWTLQTLTAFTPASEQTFELQLECQQD